MGMEVVFKERFKEAREKLAEVANQRTREATTEVRNTTISTLTGNRSGRTYNVPGTRKKYVASAPGEPPAAPTGQLRQSVKMGVEKNRSSVVGFVGTELKKGPMLEFGTKNMAARPWLRPSFEKSEDKIKEIFIRTWF